uniref:(northern house mosquito) hypothetical protein n=1 Tax=Culex pipiens TaxID=7175 RepID=A0A8D8AA62_CULPI
MSDSLAILAHGRTHSLAWWLSLYHSVGKFAPILGHGTSLEAACCCFWTVCFQLDFCLNYSIIFTSNFRVVCVTVKRQAKIKGLLLLFLLPLLGFYYLLYLKLS